MDRLTLLPCPFCGEPPREHYGEHSEEHWVACESESCDVCPTTSGGSIESARRAWNRRQSLSQEAVRDEALEAAANRAVHVLAEIMDSHFGPHRHFECAKCEKMAVSVIDGLNSALLAALKREPNAAVVQQPLQPVDPERVHAGWNKGEPVYLDEPAPAAPDVAEGDRLLQSPGASDE